MQTVKLNSVTKTDLSSSVWNVYLTQHTITVTLYKSCKSRSDEKLILSAEDIELADLFDDTCAIRQQLEFS